MGGGRQEAAEAARCPHACWTPGQTALSPLRPWRVHRHPGPEQRAPAPAGLSALVLGPGAGRQASEGHASQALKWPEVPRTWAGLSVLARSVASPGSWLPVPQFPRRQVGDPCTRGRSLQREGPWGGPRCRRLPRGPGVSGLRPAPSRGLLTALLWRLRVSPFPSLLGFVFCSCSAPLFSFRNCCLSGARASWGPRPEAAGLGGPVLGAGLGAAGTAAGTLPARAGSSGALVLSGASRGSWSEHMFRVVRGPPSWAGGEPRPGG